MEKLSRYVRLTFTLYKRKEGSKKYFYINFRRCKPEDFVKRGLKIHKEAFLNEFSKRMCPDIDSYPDLV